jgi:hypothetical protein
LLRLYFSISLWFGVFGAENKYAPALCSFTKSKYGADDEDVSNKLMDARARAATLSMYQKRPIMKTTRCFKNERFWDT